MADDQKKTIKQKVNDQQVKEETELEIKLQVETLKKEVEDYKSKYLRALADYQNLEKRIVQEKDEIRKCANSILLLQLLPFLDHLEKAEVFIKDPGLKMIKDNFLNLLEKLGLKEIKILNQEFDPNLAEAVDIVNGKQDNLVVEVTQKGYLYQDRVLRVAQVKVSKKVN